MRISRLEFPQLVFQLAKLGHRPMEQLQLTGHSTPLEEDDLDLQRVWLALRRHWRPAALVFGSVMAVAVYTTFTKEPTYEATGKLLFRSGETSSPLQGVGQQFGGLAGLVGISSKSSLATEAEVIMSAPIAQKTIDALNLRDEQGQPWSAETLLAGLAVEPVEGTDVLQVVHESNDPQQSAAIVNQLMNAYLESNEQNDKAAAVSLRKFLEQQVPVVKANVYQAEAAVRQFKEQNRIIVPEEEATLAVNTFAELEKQRNEAQNQLLEAEAQSFELRNKLGMGSREALKVSSLSQSPGVQQALEELQTIETELAKQRTVFTDENPIIQDLKDKQAELNTVLAGRVGTIVANQQIVPKNLQAGETQQQLAGDLIKSEVERLGLISRISGLSQMQTAYQQRIQNLPRLEQAFKSLVREENIAQETYKVLVAKLQEARVQEAKVLADNEAATQSQILETAKVPTGPVASNKLINLAIGGMLGGLLAVALAFFLELIDSSIKTTKEAREKLGYAVLGTIPALEGGSTYQQAYLEPSATIPVRDTPRSLVSEAYRKLQVNLQFLESDRPLQLIVVTSAVPKEGKSTISANLAMTMAQRGYRVLLIDGDLRCPAQHQIWRLPNTVGFSNLIAGETNFSAAVHRVAENLDLLTSGPLSANPSNLLNSNRLSLLVEEASSVYDCVILDTAPLAVAADALVLGKLADGMLMVVQPGVVKSMNATAAKESLEQSNQRVLGMVINGVEPEKEYSHYYSDYSLQNNETSLRRVPQKLASGIKQLTDRF